MNPQANTTAKATHFGKEGLVDDFPFPVRGYPGKRALDIFLSFLALLFTLPLFLLTALLIRLSSPGPIFYRGLRAGLRGKPFWQLKFRTMTLRHSGDPFTSQGDPRVTPIGRVLRLFRIDELPQIINILKGEMSWVGPRPEDYDIVRRCYSIDQLRVLSVRPGLTGTVQVNSFPGLEYMIPPGEDPQRYYEEVLLPQRLAEDLRYIENMSLWGDLRILFATLYCVLVKSWSVLLKSQRDPNRQKGKGGEPHLSASPTGQFRQQHDSGKSPTKTAA
jgi:lipopolysaccharide/colanic/teichoic acid biosynthesis glycosyltransferase